MTRTQLINGIINYAFETDTNARRKGNFVYLDIGEIESGDFIHLDVYVDDRCYRQGAIALQPAEGGYAVDAVEIRWAAYNDKVFHLTDEQKKGLEEWVAEWLAEDWADAGEIARQAAQLPAYKFIKRVVEQCKKFGGNPEEIQQERPEVDLEKEIKNYLATKCAGDDEPSVSEIARHFYELGLNARKEE